MPEDHTTRRFGLFTATALACGASVVAPALASAATVSVDHECYRPGQTTQVTGEGYTPGGEVALSFNLLGASGGTGSDLLLTQADSAGRIAMNTFGPVLPPKESPATVLLAATDQEQAQQGQPPLVSTQFTLENFEAFVYPWNRGTGTPGRRAQYDMAGFTLETGRTLYAHYLFNGRLRKTVAVGRLRGPCGELSKSARQFPFRPVPAGIWSIKVDTSRRYPNRSVGHRYRHVRVSQAHAVR
jgi:hypothetical protein